MSIVFDTERFIEEIHHRPCIWNVNLDENANRALKMDAWHEVAALFCEDWLTVDKKTKTKRIQELQKKWKGLRDYYNREKNRNANTTKKRERDTPILDMLHFLRINGPKPQNEGQEEIPLFYKHDEESDESRSSSVYYFNSKKKAKRDDQENDDPDMNFLLTLLPEMKAMSQSQNFDFRFEVMKVIKKIVYNKSENRPEVSYGAYSTRGNRSASSEDRKPNIRIEDDVTDGSN